MNSIDHSPWKARLEEAGAQAQSRLRGFWRDMARDPERVRRLQTGLIVLLALWSLSSASQLVWIPFSAGGIESAPTAALNPPTSRGQRQTAVIDISPVIGSGLFGGSPDVLSGDEDTASATVNRDGIERDARETRLALTLTGIVASTEDGTGNAVIRSGATEQVYAVGDALPASGQVVLAKVMPQQVVIDNNGTYELIKLYEGPMIAMPTRPASKSTASTSPPRISPVNASASAAADDAAGRSALANQYRQQLYDNPETLASAMSVSPVQEEGQIVGYRVAPGPDRAAFDTFGFQQGDIVTAVNGLALSDASNSIKLYQMMKEATEATFDIQREGGNVTLSVDLSSP